MAEFHLVEHPKYGLILSQEELDGLFTLLTEGTTTGTLELLLLDNLTRKLTDSKRANKSFGKIRSVCEFS